MINIPEDAFEGITNASNKAEQQLPGPEHQEGWGPWLKRNAMQSPTALYKFGRSGAGLGDLINYLFTPGNANVSANDPNKVIYDYLANYNAGARAGIGNQAQAQKEAEAIFPQSMTQFQPGDWLSQNIIPEAAMIGLTGGFGSLPALRSGIQSSIGAFGGGQLAEQGASLLPPEYEYLKTPLKIGGQILGGGLGQGAFNATKSLLPSKRMSPQKVVHTLKKEQGPLYETAKKMEQAPKVPATKVSETINDITRNLEGYTSEQKRYLTNMASDVNNVIERNGTISIPKAKSLRKRINNQIYDRDLATPVKGDLHAINNSLKDYILENSSAQHNKNWLRAEEATVQIKDLEKQIASSKSPITQLTKEAIKYTPAASLGAALKMFGFSGKTGAIVGGLSALGHKLFTEKEYLNQLSSSSPKLYKEYLDIVKHAGTVETAKTAQRLNRWAEKANEELPIEAEAASLEIPSEAFDYE